jgi:hypothetical protein
MAINFPSLFLAKEDWLPHKENVKIWYHFAKLQNEPNPPGNQKN